MKSPRGFRARAALLWIAACALCACSSNKAATSAAACTQSAKSRTALAQNSVCVQDDDCPCGGYCDLGVCSFQCFSNSDCSSGQRCDLHGRCRSQSDPSNLAPPPDKSVGKIELLATQDSLSPTPQRVNFVVVGQTVARARAQADPGLVVSCNGSTGNYESNCVLQNLTPGVHTIYAKSDPTNAPAKQTEFDLTLITPVQRATAGFAPPSSQTLSNSGSAGLYKGVLQFDNAGWMKSSSDQDMGEIGKSALHVTAKIFQQSSGKFLVAVDDPLHLIGNDDQWVFEVDNTGGTWTAKAPTRTFIAATDSTVLATPQFTAVSFADALDVKFDLDLSGLLGHANGVDPGSFVVQYELSLTRTGSLGAADVAPAYPADSTGTDATTLALKPLPWEAAASQALALPSVAVPSFVSTFSTIDGPGLWQCENKNTFEEICAAVSATPCNTPAVAAGSIPCVSSGCSTLKAYGCTPNTSTNTCDFPAGNLKAATGPSTCAQRYLCWQPPAPGTVPSDTDLSQVDSSLLNPSVAASAFLTSGDMQCQTTTGSAALGYFENFNRPAGTQLDAETMLDACANDLDRYWKGPGAVTGTNADALNNLAMGANGCVDGSRFEPALTHALSSALTIGMGAPATADATGSALGQRLLYQWAAIQTFVARESLDSDNMTRALSGGSAPVSQNKRTLDEYLGVSLKAWDLVLYPRIASALQGISPQVLAKPDYREWLAQALLQEPPALQHEEGVGLPVMFAEALSVQLQAATTLVNEARYAGTGQDAALKTANEATRYAVAVLALSESLAARAKSLSPAWWTRWQSSEAGAAAALQALFEEVEAMQNGENPLGLDPSDLPLRYFGNPVDPSSRFSALSDFLIGQSLSNSTANPAWAPEAVARAQSSLDAAQTQWINLRQRQLGAVMAQGQADQDLTTIENDYGEKIINLCGNQSWSADSIVDQWSGAGQYSADTCYLDTSVPGCKLLTNDGTQAGKIYDLITNDDAEVALCLGHEVRKRVGSVVGDPQSVDAINQVLKAGFTRLSISGSGTSRIINVSLQGGGNVAVPIQQLYQVDYTQASPQALADSLDACRNQYPNGRTTLPTSLDVGDQQSREPINPNCVQPGSIGDAVLEVVNSQEDLDIARQELDDVYAKEKIDLKKCADLEQDNKDLTALENAELGTLTGLRVAKLAVDITEMELKDAAQSTAEAGGLTAILQPGTEAAAGLNEAAGGFEIASMSLDTTIETATDTFENFIKQRERQGEIQQCLDDAQEPLVEAKSAALEAEKAAYDVKVAVANVGGLKAELDRDVREGKSAVATERLRIANAAAARAPLTDDRWVSAAVNQYQHDFRLAQRMTYLGVRSLEYELQESLSERSQVLAALRPSQLQDVLDSLVTTGAGSVDGKQPSSLVLVISLKNELLQLANSDGYNKDQRFGDYLAAHKVVDNQGNYTGVEIPFTLAPASPNAPAGAIKLFTGSDCAERLWSVAASVVGDNLWSGPDPSSFVRVNLLKANSFFSQWCGTPPAGQPFQVATVQPSVNLFADPALGSPAGVQVSNQDPTSTYSTARMRAFLNVSQADLEQDSYANGESTELATRGLYGNYKIFISKDFLSQAGSPGLILDHVKDILLRLDYVSVAK